MSQDVTAQIAITMCSRDHHKVHSVCAGSGWREEARLASDCVMCSVAATRPGRRDQLEKTEAADSVHSYC